MKLFLGDSFDPLHINIYMYIILPVRENLLDFRGFGLCKNALGTAKEIRESNLAKITYAGVQRGSQLMKFSYQSNKILLDLILELKRIPSKTEVLQRVDSRNCLKAGDCHTKQGS